VRLIKVWQFYDAPKKYRDLSQHGGDEDWIAVVPKALAESYIGWLQSGTSFGCCDVDAHTLPDGSVVYIGAHA
jgi:hypothetical protein